MRGDGRPSATLIGPSLQPRQLHLRAGERGWGVELAAHVFVRAMDKRQLLGEMRDLPTDGRWFELAGVRLPVLEVDALEELIDVLLRQGILAADEAVAAALSGRSVPYSQRSLHRHAVGATGNNSSDEATDPASDEAVDSWAPARVETPTAFALFPKDLTMAPRALADRHFRVERFTVMPRGGHFAALEQPALLAEDLVAFLHRRF